MPFIIPFGVKVAGSDPVDYDRYIRQDIAGRDALIGSGTEYNGLQVYVIDEQKLYILKDKDLGIWVDMANPLVLDWDNTVSYNANEVAVQYNTGRSMLYRSLTSDNIDNDPLTNTLPWSHLMSTSAPALLVFDEVIPAGEMRYLDSSELNPDLGIPVGAVGSALILFITEQTVPSADSPEFIENVWDPLSTVYTNATIKPALIPDAIGTYKSDIVILLVTGVNGITPMVYGGEWSQAESYPAYGIEPTTLGLAAPSYPAMDYSYGDIDEFTTGVNGLVVYNNGDLYYNNPTYLDGSFVENDVEPGEDPGWEILSEETPNVFQIDDLLNISTIGSNTAVSGEASKNLVIGGTNSSRTGSSAAYTTLVGAHDVVLEGSHIGMAAFGTTGGSIEGQRSSLFGGNGCHIDGSFSTIVGGSAHFINGSYSAAVGGSSNIINGYNGFIGGGQGNTANSLHETIFGSFSIEKAGIGNVWSSSDAMFTIGIGINDISRADGFVLLKNGLITAPSLTEALITNEATGRALVTREYLENNSGEGGGVVQANTAGTSIYSTVNDNIISATEPSSVLLGGSENEIGGGFIGGNTIVGGFTNKILGFSSISFILGSENVLNASGTCGALGYGNTLTDCARTYVMGYGHEITDAHSEIRLGTYSTIYTPIDQNFNPTDRLLTLGNSVDPGNRSDALIILKNGTITAPSMTEAMITAESTGKVLITREYLENNASGDISPFDIESTNVTTNMQTNFGFSATTNSMVVFGYWNTIENSYHSLILSGGQHNMDGANHSVIGGGYNQSIESLYSFIGGGTDNSSISTGGYSFIGGGSNNVTGGRYSVVPGGRGNTASTYSEWVGGIWSTEVSGNPTAWVATDRLFTVGNGTAFDQKSDAFSILKNGTITAPSLTDALINIAGDKALITKEYADNNYAGGGGISKFASNIGDNAATSIVVTHSLGSRDVSVSIYRATAPYDEVDCDVFKTDINTVTLEFTTAPTLDEYRVTIIG